MTAARREAEGEGDRRRRQRAGRLHRTLPLVEPTPAAATSNRCSGCLIGRSLQHAEASAESPGGPGLAKSSEEGRQVRSDRLGLVVLVVAGIASLFVSTAPASAAVSVGQSGWTLGQPAPPGERHQRARVLGQPRLRRRKVRDAPADRRRRIRPGPACRPASLGTSSRVRIIDSDSLVFAGGCAVRRSDDAGASFVRLPWTASDLNCPETDRLAVVPHRPDRLPARAQRHRLPHRRRRPHWARKTGDPGHPRDRRTGPTPRTSSSPASDTGVAITTSGRDLPHDRRRWLLDARHCCTTERAEGTLLRRLRNFGFAVGARSHRCSRTIDGGFTWAVDVDPAAARN